MTRDPQALVFDAYGTLFDVHSVTRLADSLFAGRGVLPLGSLLLRVVLRFAVMLTSWSAVCNNQCPG